MKWINRVSLLLLLVLGAVMFFSSYTRQEQVGGSVEVVDGGLRITARKAGLVVAQQVREGQQVKAGQPLLTLSGDSTNLNGRSRRQLLSQESDIKRRSVNDEIANLDSLFRSERQALQGKQAGLRSQIERTQAEIGVQERRVKVANERLERKKELVDSGFISRVALLDDEEKMLELAADNEGYKSKLAALHTELREVAAKLANLEGRRASERLPLDRTLSALRAEAIDHDSAGEFVITAPIDGLVGTLLAKTGEAVDEKSLLLTLSPAQPEYVARLLVPSSAIGFVHEGMPIKLRYQAYPFEQFGEHDAVISAVSSSALSAEELRASGASAVGSYFRVFAKPAQQAVQFGARSFALRDGMQLQALMPAETRKLYEWILKPFFAGMGAVKLDAAKPR